MEKQIHIGSKGGQVVIPAGYCNRKARRRYYKLKKRGNRLHLSQIDRG